MSEALAEFRQELAEIKQQVASRPSPWKFPRPCRTDEEAELDTAAMARWARCCEKAVCRRCTPSMCLTGCTRNMGKNPPYSLGEEISPRPGCFGGLLAQARAAAPKSLHVLIGPAGCGKTTYLCKWLTQAVLVEGRMARVWRLDGATANTAESLSVYCEILGAPNERVWQGSRDEMAEDIGFIDLPGVDWRKPAAVQELAGQLKQFGPRATSSGFKRSI